MLNFFLLIYQYLECEFVHSLLTYYKFEPHILKATVLFSAMVSLFCIVK